MSLQKIKNVLKQNIEKTILQQLNIKNNEFKVWILIKKRREVKVKLNKNISCIKNQKHNRIRDTRDKIEYFDLVVL